jgi:hypothetical protein
MGPSGSEVGPKYAYSAANSDEGNNHKQRVTNVPREVTEQRDERVGNYVSYEHFNSLTVAGSETGDSRDVTPDPLKDAVSGKDRQ